MTFGDGSDGDVVISVNNTLTSDMNYHNLTIDDGAILYPDGYVIYVSNQLLINGTINRNGNNGSQPGGGAALPTRSVGGSGAGGSGGWFFGGWRICRAGHPGSNISNGVSGSDGGRGAAGDGNPGCAGGAKGQTLANHEIDASNVIDLITKAADRLGGAGGGGGGSAWLIGPHWDFSHEGFGGGGGGGVIYISAKYITIGVTGIVTANGGNGPGFWSCTNWNGAAGAGGGGGGGFIAFEYETIVNDGTVTVNGGTTGLACSTPGEPGTTGTIVSFVASRIQVGNNVLLIPNYCDIYDRACIKGENINVGDDVKVYPLKNNSHVSIKERWSLNDKITIRGANT